MWWKHCILHSHFGVTISNCVRRIGGIRALTTSCCSMHWALGNRDVGAFSKVRPRLLQLRFGVFAAENQSKTSPKSPKSVQTKTSKSRGRLELDEARGRFSRHRHCVRSCPMGCLEGINRRSARPKPLSSLPTACTACTTRKSQIPVEMTLWLGRS